MARKAAEKKEANYKEFKIDGVVFSYTGRLYPENESSTARCDIIPFSLCLNGCITIKGCKLFRTDKNSWISGPSYKGKDGDYKEYIYIDKQLNPEMDKLISGLEAILDA